MTGGARTFEQAAGAVLDAYAKQDYAACLTASLDARDRFPEHGARTTYWVACMRSLTGDVQAAIDELRGGLDRGYWWTEEWLRTDPDLEAVRGEPAFDAVARRANDAFRRLARMPATEPVVERPARAASCVLVALHGSAGTAKETAEAWRASVEHGTTLVVPESPYRATPDDEHGRTWPSVKESGSIVAETLATIDPSDISRKHLVVGGFSHGGRIAALLAATARPQPWRGAILFAPAPVDLAGVEPIADDLRFWIFVGQDDRACSGPAHALRDELEGAGSRVLLETQPGIGHDYPSDVDVRLNRALSFVLDR